MRTASVLNQSAYKGNEPQTMTIVPDFLFVCPKCSSVYGIPGYVAFRDCCMDALDVQPAPAAPQKRKRRRRTCPECKQPLHLVRKQTYACHVCGAEVTYLRTNE